MDRELELTSEERALLHRWDGAVDSRYNHLAYYAAIFLPMVAFAIYGVLRNDVIAVAIAFGGMFLYEVWRVTNDMSRSRTYRSLMTKIAERERTGG